MFGSALCYDNVDDYDFSSCKMFSHYRCSWVKCCYFHCMKIKWKVKINEKWYIDVNQGLLNIFIKLLVYNYIKKTY
jgi:hypothetical protein